MFQKPSIVCLLLAVLVALACRTTAIYNVTRSGVPPGLSTSLVGDVIEQVASRRGWTTQRDNAGHITASIKVRNKHSATVDIVYDAESFRITYRNSKNLLYGNGKIHRNYNGWITRLEGDIRTELSQASREATRRS